MFCAKCGKEIPVGTVFCGSCGAAVSEKEQPNEQVSKGHAMMNQAVFQPKSAEIPGKEKSAKGFQVWIAGGAVLGIAVIIFYVILLVNSFKTSGFSYEIKDDTVTIIGYKNDSVEVVIPKKIKGKPVTEIGDSAFIHCNKLRSLSIPESVTSIGENAFSGCINLEEINIPEGVTSIGEDAFSGCSSLQSISIPKSVSSIGENAFSGCSSLQSISIPESVSSIGEGAFSGCSSLKNISIPKSVTSIEADTFSECSSLESIYIPKSVTNIERSAFSGCDNLKKIYGESMSSAGWFAFWHNYTFIKGEIPE